MGQFQVERLQQRLMPQQRRVLAKPYLPGEEVLLSGRSRAAMLMERILAIPESEVSSLLAAVLASFERRHRDFRGILLRHFELVATRFVTDAPLSSERQLLIGAYFTHEYSTEAAALFNPSIVPAPQQEGVSPGELRFVMSLRAVGEGHLSSIEFRSGLLGPNGEISFDELGPYLVGGQRTSPTHYDRRLFATKLDELGAANDLAQSVLRQLPERFTLIELESALSVLEAHGPPPAIWFETVKIMRVLAASNYITTFPPDSQLSERVIFPAGPNETRGMEDARFVRFVDDDGTAKYYATYTAYDGFQILPQLIETDDFVTFSISTLHGAAAQNKGMALFPRRVGGSYVMLSRKDRENLHLVSSSDVRYWNEATELSKPTKAWELLHIGNCGSPLETEAGWLVITHGVGPMRQYVLGALLLDLEDPSKIIGQMAEPLLSPNANEREGYVPNVVYTCGALIHAGKLILPYGFSDHGVCAAVIPLGDVLAELSAPH